MSVRVRFAPSPTGYLHVGGARTALFNYLLARKLGGTFVLRIEDTDAERSTPEFTDAILEGMRWLGFSPDEGPYFQADGFERHREQARFLIRGGRAYPIFGDDFPEGAPRPPRPAIRERALLLGGVRDGRDPNGTEREALWARMEREPYAIALRVPEIPLAWEDLVHGPLSFDPATIEDFLLVRSDGTPLYNMACVSDDIEHGITHVLRGDDHIANTPKQILLHRMLADGIPRFGHLPMILGPDGQRMSKRHGATSVQEYARQGILPGALANFLSLLGWNPGDEREILTLEEMVDAFALERVHKKAAVFDPAKLEWMNGVYIQQTPAPALVEQVEPFLLQAGLDVSVLPEAHREVLVEQLKPRSRTLSQMAEGMRPFLTETVSYDPDAVAKHWISHPEEALRRLRSARDHFESLSSWTLESVHEAMATWSASLGLGMGKVMPGLRLALTGSLAGLSMDQTLWLLGPARVQARIGRAMDWISTQSGSAV